MSNLANSDNKIEAFQTLVQIENTLLFQHVDFTGTSQYSAVFEASTSIVELFCTQDCWVRLVRSTASDVAAANASSATKGYSQMVRGGIVKFIGIPQIENVLWKLAVISNGTNGVLDISEGG